MDWCECKLPRVTDPFSSSVQVHRCGTCDRWIDEGARVVLPAREDIGYDTRQLTTSMPVILSCAKEP